MSVPPVPAFPRNLVPFPAFLVPAFPEGLKKLWGWSTFVPNYNPRQIINRGTASLQITFLL